VAHPGGSSPAGESVRELGSPPFLFVVGLKLDLKLIRTLGFVPVDFSIYSRCALEFATRLVANGDFVVLRAYDLPSTGFLPDVGHPGGSSSTGGGRWRQR
jgi:hypothetical protein